MTSWRDGASSQAQEQLEELLNVCLGVAQRQLAERGEFFPYAMALADSGGPQLIAARPPGGAEQPAAADVITACVETLVDERDQFQAAAVTADVSTSEGDAIRVELEHSEGTALTILLPYSKQDADATIDYGQVRAQPGRPQVWADP